MLATVETKSSGMGRLTVLLKAVIGTPLADFAYNCLTPASFTLGHEYVWDAAFMAISVFNGGFVSGGLVPNTDWWMLVPLFWEPFVGAIGFLLSPTSHSTGALPPDGPAYKTHTDIHSSVFFGQFYRFCSSPNGRIGNLLGDLIFRDC